MTPYKVFSASDTHFFSESTTDNWTNYRRLVHGIGLDASAFAHHPRRQDNSIRIFHNTYYFVI